MRAGKNPADTLRQVRSEGLDPTFGALAAQFLADIENPLSDEYRRSADQYRANLNRHVLPKWRNRDYRSISRGDVVKLVSGIVKAGAPVQANRIQSLIGRIFSYALDAGHVTSHPAVRLKKRGKEGVGHRVLSDAEISLIGGASFIHR